MNKDKDFDIIVRSVNGCGWLGIVKVGNKELYRTWDFLFTAEIAFGKAEEWMLKNYDLIVDANK